MQKELAVALVEVLKYEGFDAEIHEKYKGVTGVTTGARAGQILSAVIKNADDFVACDDDTGDVWNIFYNASLSIDGLGLQYIIY